MGDDGTERAKRGDNTCKQAPTLVCCCLSPVCGGWGLETRSVQPGIPVPVFRPID